MLLSQHPQGRVARLGGVASRPNIDNFRESLAVKVAAALARCVGRQIQIVEPFARGLPSSSRALVPNFWISTARSPPATCSSSSSTTNSPTRSR